MSTIFDIFSQNKFVSFFLSCVYIWTYSPKITFLTLWSTLFFYYLRSSLLCSFLPSLVVIAFRVAHVSDITVVLVAVPLLGVTNPPVMEIASNMTHLPLFRLRVMVLIIRNATCMRTKIAWCKLAIRGKRITGCALVLLRELRDPWSVSIIVPLSYKLVFHKKIYDVIDLVNILFYLNDIDIIR